VAVLLAFTFGGGLQTIHDFWSARLDGLTYGVALIFSVALVSAIVDLPLALYRQFVIEANFGFNRMTLKIFISRPAETGGTGHRYWHTRAAGRTLADGQNG
jgi:STE24 endopeptidase